MKFTKEEFKKLDKSYFETWYENNLKFFKNVEAQLNYDLKKFSEQSVKDRLVFFTSRIKNANDFLDKIDRIKLDEKKLTSIYGRRRKLKINEIVEDVVGARLVFYFENDLHWGINFFTSYPLFKVKKAKYYQSSNEMSPYWNKENSFLLDQLREYFPKIVPKQKKSLYESIHLIVKYESKYLLYRNTKISIKANKSESKLALQRKAKIVSGFSFEVQIRTVLQHTWAQIEHQMNYGIKRGLICRSKQDYILDDFRCHKNVLNAAESHQTIMYNRWWASQSETLNEKSIGVGKRRLKYFKNSEIRKGIEKINRAIQTDPEKGFDVLKEQLPSILSSYQDNLLNLKQNKDVKIWGRQRIILMFFGYLFLSDDDNFIFNTADFFIKHSRGFDLNKTAKNEYASKVYEYIRFVDGHFAYSSNLEDKDKKFFLDPLVCYRNATALIKIGNYRRAAHYLTDSVDGNYFDNFEDEKSSQSVLSKKHFCRRIGEYHLILYLKYGCKSYNDLTNAYGAIFSSLSSACKDSEYHKKETEKALSSYIIICFLLYITRDTPRFNEFRKEIESMQTYVGEINSYYIVEILFEKKFGYSLLALAAKAFVYGQRSAAKDYADMSARYINFRGDNVLHCLAIKTLRGILIES